MPVIKDHLKRERNSLLLFGCSEQAARGNDAPVLWMYHARGYDLNALRKRESELERELRVVREENAALRRVLLKESST